MKCMVTRWSIWRKEVLCKKEENVTDLTYCHLFPCREEINDSKRPEIVFLLKNRVVFGERDWDEKQESGHQILISWGGIWFQRVLSYCRQSRYNTPAQHRMTHHISKNSSNLSFNWILKLCSCLTKICWPVFYSFSRVYHSSLMEVLFHSWWICL